MESIFDYLKDIFPNISPKFWTLLFGGIIFAVFTGFKYLLSLKVDEKSFIWDWFMHPKYFTRKYVKYPMNIHGVYWIAYEDNPALLKNELRLSLGGLFCISVFMISRGVGVDTSRMDILATTMFAIIPITMLILMIPLYIKVKNQSYYIFGAISFALIAAVFNLLLMGSYPSGIWYVYETGSFQGL